MSEKKIILEKPSPEMIEAMKPFLYEMYPNMKKRDELKELLSRRNEVTIWDYQKTLDKVREFFEI